MGGRDHTRLDWTLECGIKESRLPKRFLIMDILIFVNNIISRPLNFTNQYIF